MICHVFDTLSVWHCSCCRFERACLAMAVASNLKLPLRDSVWKRPIILFVVPTDKTLMSLLYFIKFV